MQETGVRGCSRNATCHAIGSGVIPELDNNDPSKMYATLNVFIGIRGKPYINPCSQNLDDSTFRCNLNPFGSPDVCGSAMPKGGVVLPGDMQKLETWIKCGSPNN